MKKLFAFILLISSVFSFTGCAEKEGLSDNVSFLRYAVFSGKTENYLLKAYAEKKETPQSFDGKVGAMADYFTVIIENDLPESAYSYSFSLNGKTYSGAFTLDYASGKYRFVAEIDGKIENPPSVTVLNVGRNETAELSSVLPSGTLSPERALAEAYKFNPTLFDSFKNGDGVFAAEIELKITVKNDAPYYYIAIISATERKVFLADGFSGKVLAVRTVV